MKYKANVGDLIRLITPPNPTWRNTGYLEEYTKLWESGAVVEVVEVGGEEYDDPGCPTIKGLFNTAQYMFLDSTMEYEIVFTT